MGQLIGCPDPGIFFSAVALVMVLFTSVVGGGVWLLARFLPEDGVAFWPTVVITSTEPVAYALVSAVYGLLARTIWSFEYVPTVVFGLGAAVVFVASVGLRGHVLGRANPDVGERRRTLLAVAFALPVPVIAAVVALVVVL